MTEAEIETLESEMAEILGAETEGLETPAEGSLEDLEAEMAGILGR